MGPFSYSRDLLEPIESWLLGLMFIVPECRQFLHSKLLMQVHWEFAPWVPLQSFSGTFLLVFFFFIFVVYLLFSLFFYFFFVFVLCLWIWPGALLEGISIKPYSFFILGFSECQISYVRTVDDSIQGHLRAMRKIPLLDVNAFCAAYSFHYIYLSSRKKRNEWYSLIHCDLLTMRYLCMLHGVCDASFGQVSVTSLSAVLLILRPSSSNNEGHTRRKWIEFESLDLDVTL